MLSKDDYDLKTLIQHLVKKKKINQLNSLKATAAGSDFSSNLFLLNDRLLPQNTTGL